MRWRLEMGDQQGSRDVLEALCKLRGDVGVAHAHGVEERPCGPGHRVGNERLDVIRHYLAVESV